MPILISLSLPRLAPLKVRERRLGSHGGGRLSSGGILEAEWIRGESGSAMVL